MKTIVETTLLEFGRSVYTLDLNRHTSGAFYVELIQKVEGEHFHSSIRINSTVITDFIKVLQNYEAKIPKTSNYVAKHLSATDQQKIQDRYLKGVSTKDLALQFNQTEELIEMILRNKGIEIVPQQIPKHKSAKSRKRR